MYTWELTKDIRHLIWDLRDNKFVNNTNVKQRNSIEIGEHVWIGGETVIMPNTHIGSGSICGYRTLAKGTYPNNVIIAGQPGKIIKKDIAWMRRNVSYDDNDISLLDEAYRRYTQQ